MKLNFLIAYLIFGSLCHLSQIQGQNEMAIDEVAWSHKNKGLNNHTEIGYLFNTQKENEERGLSLRHSIGYMIRPILVPSVGIGYDQYSTQSLLPLYVELKGDFISGQKYSPFYFGQFGTALSTTDDEEFPASNETFAYEGGAYFQVGLGLKVRTAQNMDWTFSVGYLNQDHSVQRTFDDPTGPGRLQSTMNETSSRVSARIGFVF